MTTRPARLLMLAAVASALLTSACGGSASSITSSASLTPTETTASPTVASPSASDSTPAPKPTAEAAKSACKPATMLKAVQLRRDMYGLTIRWTLAAVPASFDTLLLSATAASPDGNQVLQFGAKYINGQPGNTFTFDFVTSQQNDIAPPPPLATTVEVIYPVTGTVFADGPFKWNAALSVDGDDVAGCPATNPAAKVAFPSA